MTANCNALFPDHNTHVLHHLHVLEALMTEFANDQAHLDADVLSLGNITASIETEIANLKTANPALDFTGLDAAVSKLQTVAPSAPPAPAPTPAEPAPAPTEPTPADATPTEPPTA